MTIITNKSTKNINKDDILSVIPNNKIHVLSDKNS